MSISEESAGHVGHDEEHSAPGSRETCSIPNFGAWLSASPAETVASGDRSASVEQGSALDHLKTLGTAAGSLKKRSDEARVLNQMLKERGSQEPSELARPAGVEEGKAPSGVRGALGAAGSTARLASGGAGVASAAVGLVGAVSALERGDYEQAGLSSAQGSLSGATTLQGTVQAASDAKPHVVGALDRLSEAAPDEGRLSRGAQRASSLVSELGEASSLKPALNAVRVGAKVAGPAAAFLDSGLNVYGGVKSGSKEQMAIGATQAVAGGLMVAGVFFPPAEVAGSLLYGSTLLWQNREAIAHSATKVAGWAAEGGKAAGHGAAVVAREVGHVADEGWNKAKSLGGSVIGAVGGVVGSLLD